MLKKFTGIIISANTISKYVYCEAKNIRKMLTTRSNAQKEFIEASGVTELMTDGTMVNTIKGWKEVRLIQASKRQLGDYANADTLSERHLPKPTVVYCLGFLESSKRFVSRWSGFAKLLHIHNFAELHFISDGAGWIWRGCQKHFPNCQGCLDYYHGCEHISQCAEELFKDKVQKQEFYESCRLALLREGWNGIREVIDQYRQQISVYKWKNYLSKLYNYFEKRQDELTYRSRLANGYAIGSGEIEGACKQLVGRRLKQTGARWKISNLNKMLSVICAVHNNTWDLYWTT